MTVFDYILIGLVSSAILSLLLSFISIGRFLWQRTQISRFPHKLPKNKKKRIRLKREKALLIKKKRKSLILISVFLVISGGLGGGAAYASYLQSINLSSDDSTLIVRSYYLLRNFQEELNKAGIQEDDEATSIQNIRYLATNLAAFSSKNASRLNKPEAQSMLNKYYALLSQLGVNVTRESTNLYGNEELVTLYQADVDNIISTEEEVFNYFKVNQDSFVEENSDGE